LKHIAMLGLLFALSLCLGNIHVGTKTYLVEVNDTEDNTGNGGKRSRHGGKDYDEFLNVGKNVFNTLNLNAKEEKPKNRETQINYNLGKNVFSNLIPKDNEAPIKKKEKGGKKQKSSESDSESSSEEKEKEKTQESYEDDSESSSEEKKKKDGGKKQESSEEDSESSSEETKEGNADSDGDGIKDAKDDDDDSGDAVDDDDDTDSDSGQGDGDLSKFREQTLDRINMYRGQHGADDLSLDPKLNDFAQNHAEELISSGEFTDSNGPYGENGFEGFGDIDGNTAVDVWQSQEKKYNFDNPNPSSENTHFTANVWKGSKKLGVGKATDTDGRTIVVANFDPAGNKEGKYKQNVGRKEE